MLGLSVCRNPKLAAIFYRLQLIEAYGTGMPKIMKAYAGTGLEPKIEVTNNAFKITLPNRNAARIAYDKLTLEQKEKVTKIEELENAEKLYHALNFEKQKEELKKELALYKDLVIH